MSNAELTTQQTEAVAHIQQWRVGALFMEPGTGKTRAALELLRGVPDADAVLWVAPLRTLGNLHEEVEKWGGVSVPSMAVGVESLSSSARKYAAAVDFLKGYKCPFMIVDESLKIKNSQAIRTQRVIDLGQYARYKLILNGTPLTRNLLDLWAQMEFLSPKILNMTEAQFRDTFCEYTVMKKRVGNKWYEKQFITGFENVDYLFSLIRNYVYECDLHLNITQNYHVVPYHVGGEWRDEYNRLKAWFLDEETLIWKKNNIFLELTQKIQHSYCCCDGKQDAVTQLFKKIPQENSIIFCKFIDSQEFCKKMYPKARVLSYQKEAYGLNLQQYNYTIFWDKVMDYALRVQATRRTFRTGQEYACHYYDLTGDVGLEVLIDKNISKKVNLSEYFKNINIKELQKQL